MKAKTVIQNGTVQTLCRMCDTRCAVNIHIQDGVMVDITPYEHHPVNQGQICARGPAAIDLFYHPDRILKPLKRMSDGHIHARSPMNQAMDEIAEKILHIKETLWSQSDGGLERRSCRVLPARGICQALYPGFWISQLFFK